jgi:hypothetical protein
LVTAESLSLVSVRGKAHPGQARALAVAKRILKAMASLLRRGYFIWYGMQNFTRQGYEHAAKSFDNRHAIHRNKRQRHDV